MDYFEQPQELERKTKRAEDLLKSTEPDHKPELISLLNFQRQRNLLYSQYLAESRALQTKYEQLYAPVYQERQPVVMAIPNFWLTVLKRHHLTRSFVQNRDEPLLGFLTKISCEKDPASDNFTLLFEFSPNEFIQNRVLAKTYVMASADEMEKAEGTEIIWKGENLTQKTRKLKGKKGGPCKQVSCLSFFNFFKSVIMPGTMDLEVMDERLQAELRDSVEEDLDLATEIRDEIIPNAVLYFVGAHEEPVDTQKEQSTKVDASGTEQSQCKNQ